MSLCCLKAEIPNICILYMPYNYMNDNKENTKYEYDWKQH